MRLPRVRFTVRAMMIAVAVVALIFEAVAMLGRGLTAEDAKIALVDMLRREAVRDASLCRAVWGSTVPDQQLAAVTIGRNSDGTSQIGIFTVRLDEQNYFFWLGLGRFDGSFEWEHGGWRASDYGMTAQGCIIGQGSRK
jgi:hypothetical protein